MKRLNPRRRQQSGNAIFAILGLLTFFVFIGVLVLQYQEMLHYQEDGMWPKDSGLLYKRTDTYAPKGQEGATYVAPKPVNAPVAPVTPAGTNAPAPDAAAPDGTNAPSATPAPAN